MNWGYKIILGFILFAAFVFTLVFKMITSGNDLVKTKYFKTGAQVNDDIILHQSSQGIENGLKIFVSDPENHLVDIQFTGQAEGLTGNIELTCLSSDKADLKLPLELQIQNGKWQQHIRLPVFQHGNWLCEVRGNTAGKPFLVKTSFKI